MNRRFRNRPTHIAAILGISAACLGLSGCKHDPNKQKQKYLASGKHYEEEGKLREAVIQFSNALKVDKNFAPAHYELAKTYIQLGSLVAGYQELQRTVALNPGNLQARLDLGNMLLAGGVPDRAKEQAKAILAAQPNNADGYALLSRIAWKQGDKAEALKDIQQAISLNPNESKYHTSLGLIEAQNADTKGQGEAELEKAVTLDDKNPNARLALAGILANKGDMPGAEKQVESAIQASPKDLQPRIALAEIYLHGGDKAKAEQALIDAVNALPDKDQSSDILLNYYIHTGQADRAEAVFSDLKGKYPKSLPIQITYTRVLLGRGKWDQAEDSLKTLSKNNGNNPQVARMNAEVLLHQGKPHDAFTMLQKAAGNAPDDARLQLLLAQTAMSVGNQSAAEAAFQQAGRLDPQSLEAARGLAQLASVRKDLTRLNQLAEKTIQAHPNAPDGYIWRGSAEGAQQQFAQAEADFQAALKRDPNNAAAQIDLAELELHQKRTAEARTLLEQALNHDPNLIPALNLLVSADLADKQPEKALARVQAQIAKVPNSPALYADLAQLQLGTKDFNGAQASAQKALQLNKDYEPAVETYSQAQLALGNSDAALGAWQNWLSAHPNDARGDTLAGSIEETKGDVNKAMAYYKKALQLDSQQPVAANNLAFLMVENNENSDVALSYAQTARRLLPQAPNTADTLAWVYYHKGTYSLAKDLLQDAAKQDPGNASIHYHLGLTLSKMGDKSGAATELKKASELAPNSQAGKEASDALGHLGV
jgi:cellulose synthase operon protein C